MESTDVFPAGMNGIALYRIPGIVATSKGTVLAYCEARKNARSDWGEIEVHLRRSTDGGKTWNAPQHIAHNGSRIEGNPNKKNGGEREQTVNNPVAIVIERRVQSSFCTVSIMLDASRCAAPMTD